MPKSDQSRWWIAAEAALLLALVVTPWCFGGAPLWTLWLLLGAGAVAVVTWTIGAHRHHRRWSFHPALLLPAGAVLLCVVQLIPLPPPLLALLSPPSAELRDFTLIPLGHAAWRPVSLDVPSTLRACARFIALGALLFVSLELSRQESVRWRLMAVQAAMGMLIAVVGFGHMLADAEALFGVHQFVATLSLITPFGNTNHLAAYLAFSGTVALALALSTRSRDVAIAWAAAALVCGVGVFLSFSRGGIVTFVGTWALVGASVLAARGGGLRAVVPWVVMGATVLFAALFAFEQLVARADTVSSVDKVRATKLDLWPMLWSGELRTWPLGMGAGAFELGFSRWQTTQPDVTFTHPENIVLQSVADWGLVVTVVLVAGTLWLVRRTWVRAWAMPMERTVLLALVG
ncbi:MAG: O-antigen ligase family protein, partial [Archangium sp.]